jgi:uncharacterized protein (TIGR03083 family)
MTEHTLRSERPTYEDSVKALESEVASILTLLDQLRDDQWHLPTRLPGWDLFILVAHLTRTIKTLADYAALGTHAPAMPAVASDPVEAGREVDARSRSFAEGHTPSTLRAELRRVAVVVAATARRLGPAAEIPRRGGRTNLDRYVRTRVVEACVHGLDLRAALGSALEPTPLALRVAVSYFEELLARRDATRPDDLADDVAFIESASGRRPYLEPPFPLLQ